MSYLRLGKLTYLNNLPMYYHFFDQHPELKESCSLVEGNPFTLNALIREGKIELSVISSIEYARNTNKYLILPDLSISSVGAVRSVLFFCQRPLEELGDLAEPSILITSDSETSVALLKIILAQKGIKPLFIRGQIPKENEPLAALGHNFSCLLVIGDRALQLQETSPFPLVYDLGELWQKMTGLPFVYALWIVRQEIYHQDRDLVIKIWQALRSTRHYSLSHLEELAASVPSSLTPDRICHYLQNLNYTLPLAHQQGLMRFYHLLWKIGELEHEVTDLSLLKEG